MKNLLKHFNFKLGDQPPGFYTLLYTETCELYGQFSITALLILYMTQVFKTGDNEAFICYGAFTAFIYAIPLIGGYLADKVAGFKHTLLLGILLMCVGNLVLIIPNVEYLYLGLAIFGAGCGFFTPAITAILGRLYANHDKQRDNAFTLYYIAKNLGALLATLGGSLIATRYSYNYAYILSSAVMLSGFIVFLLGSNKLKPYLDEKNISKKQIALVLGLSIGLVFATKYILIAHLADVFMLGASLLAALMLAKLYMAFSKEDRKKLYTMLLAMVMMVIFSLFLGQGGTTLNLFIDRIVDRNLGNFTIPTSFFYALDPFFMILFGSIVMSLLEKIRGRNYITIGFTKIAIGLGVLGLGFIIVSLAAQVMIGQEAKPSYQFIVFAYALFPIAELSIMPIVISLITRLSPKGYEGFMIGIYMLSNAIASYLTGQFSKIATISFTMNSASTQIMGAKIYQHAFLISAFALFACTVVSLALITRKNKMPELALEQR